MTVKWHFDHKWCSSETSDNNNCSFYHVGETRYSKVVGVVIKTLAFVFMVKILFDNFKFSSSRKNPFIWHLQAPLFQRQVNRPFPLFVTWKSPCVAQKGQIRPSLLLIFKMYRELDMCTKLNLLLRSHRIRYIELTIRSLLHLYLRDHIPFV